MTSIFQKKLRHRERETYLAKNILALRYVELIHDIKSWEEFESLFQRHQEYPWPYRYSFHTGLIHDVFVLGHGTLIAADANKVVRSSASNQMKRLYRFITRRLLLGSLQEVLPEIEASRIHSWILNEITHNRSDVPHPKVQWREFILEKMTFANIKIDDDKLIISHSVKLDVNQARILLHSMESIVE